jgi:hypothetical protein
MQGTAWRPNERLHILSAAATGRQDGIFQTSNVTIPNPKTAPPPKHCVGTDKLPVHEGGPSRGEDMASTLFCCHHDIQTSNISPEKKKVNCGLHTKTGKLRPALRKLFVLQNS